MNLKKYIFSSVVVVAFILHPLLRAEEENKLTPRQFLIEVKKNVHDLKVFEFAKKQLEERDLRQSQNRAIANSQESKNKSADEIQANVLLKVYENHLAEEKHLSSDESALLKRLTQK